VKLALIAYGTRGDVQPLLCLAWALKRRGHEVRLLAPRDSMAWIARAGVPATALPVDVPALFNAEPAQRMLANGRITAFFKWLAAAEQAYAGAMCEALIAGTEGAEAIVCHALMEDRAAAIGAARGIPVLPSYFFPVPPSRHFPSPFISTRNLGPLNRLTHKLLLDMLWKSSRGDADAIRRTLGAPPARMSYTRWAQWTGAPCLLAYSAALFPPPADWGGHNKVVGGIAMPAELRSALGEAGLPPDLEAWLDSGSKPVFLGFGSMPVLDVERMLANVRAALHEVGARAVLGAGWSNLGNLADARLFAVGAVDHSALLPRVAAAVHHGGAGTTYASLRAGVPTLICAVFADQPFWGARCRALGVGDTLAFRRLDAASLAQGLRRVLAPEVAAAARDLGGKLAAEDGLAAAVRVIERELPGAAPPA
jgi:sterol 3beta-glucosyltransferase